MIAIVLTSAQITRSRAERLDIRLIYVPGIHRGLHSQTTRYLLVLAAYDRVVELGRAVCWCSLWHPLITAVLLAILP